MKKNRRNNSRPAAITTAKDTTKAIETRAGVLKEAWKTLGKNVDEIKTLNVYLKPEEAAAYYVINEETTGKVAI